MLSKIMIKFPVRNLWRHSWIILLPILAVQVTWLYRTVDMYRELGLRNLGDTNLAGMTLHEAGRLQFHHLTRSITNRLHQAAARDTTDLLPRIHLFIQERDLSRLDSARPASGMDYVDARLLYKDEFAEVKARYRGDFAYHWGYFKRSIRIKTKRNNLFSGIRRFNLVIPKSGFLYSNHAGYELARLVGLLAPASELVVLNLNGHDQGLMLLVEQISESTLRNAGRLPGDIYSGDNYYGLDVWHGLERDTLFEQAGVWRKTAINNHYPADHDQPLRHMLDLLAADDIDALLSIIDVNAFARLSLWEYLAQTDHLDNTHNWRLYYDPGTGKFSPLLWDGMPWRKQSIPENWQSILPRDPVLANQLMDVLLTSASFNRERNRVFAEFFNSDKPEALLDKILTWNQILGEQADRETVILSEGPISITSSEARARMKEVHEIVSHIISKGRQDYREAPERASPITKLPFVWEEDIVIHTDTRIDQPVRITAGTIIKLAPGASLFFDHQVMIEGTSDKPVSFLPLNAHKPWGAIVIEGNNARGSVLAHFEMRGGSGYKDDLREYSGMLSIHGVSDISLENCSLASNSLYDDQLHVVYSDIDISGCRFEDAPMDAVDLDMTTAKISSTTFINNGNDGLDLMGSEVSGTDLVFENNQDKGISIGERSNLQLTRSQFRNNQIGLQVKDDSLLFADNLTLSDNGIAVDAYAKNWRYETGGKATICQSIFNDNTKRSQADKHSEVTITNACEILPNSANLRVVTND